MDSQNVVRLNPAPSVAELRAMSPLSNPRDEARRIATILAASSEDDAASALSWMFKILPMGNVGGDEEDRRATMQVLMEGYLMAVREYPRWAIVEARDAFIRGAVDGFNSSFAPNPADLGREIARRVDDYRMRLGRALKAEREMEAFRDHGAQGGGISPEARAKVDAGIARLQAYSESQRIPEREGPDPYAAYRRSADAPYRTRPLTAEDVAHVPDAPPRGMQRIPVPSYNPLPGRGA